MSTAPARPLIDAHHHYWNPSENYHPWLCDEPPIAFRYGDYSAIRRSYMPEQYFADAGHHNIVATVYVEAEWDPNDPGGEVDWVDALHARTGHPGAVVAQAWLDREDVADVLAYAARSQLVRSVRHKPRAAASPGDVQRGAPGSMDDPRWRDGYALLARHGLHFDLQTPWWHLDAAVELARDFPGTKLILNHTGLPSDRGDAGLRGWHQAMSRLAECENVYVKISGLGQPDVPWSVEANGWIVRETVNLFSPARAMLASNFPVDGLCVDMVTLFDGFKAIVADLPEAAQNALFHDTAAAVYRPVTGAAGGKAEAAG